MSKKLLSSLAALVTAIAGMGIVKADTGYAATFTSSITYSNVGTGSASVLMNFYDQASGTAIPVTRPSLAPGASSSLFLGSTSLTAGFNGSAIISSDQPIAATAVQIATNAGTLVKNRPLSNGFASGAAQVLIASTLRAKFNNTTRFNVQNASSANADITVSFYDADNAGQLKATLPVVTLPAGAAKTFDLGAIAALPDGFNGSAVVNAVQTGGTTPANIVASALELSTTGVGASAFEGVTGGANTVYMATALCNAFGGFNSFYAVQNTSSATNAQVTVTYSNGVTDAATVTPGAKKSFATCSAPNMPQGFSGAATVTSTGGAIVAIGKVGGLGATTAFLGETAGNAKLACPYVRWTPLAVYNSGLRQRANIAIQNVGGALAAGAVTVKYIDAAGAVKASQPLGALATGAKQSVNSSQTALGDTDFGVDASLTNFGGGVTIEGPAGTQLVAITRIGSSDPGGATGYAEDYNCIPF